METSNQGMGMLMVGLGLGVRPTRSTVFVGPMAGAFGAALMLLAMCPGNPDEPTIPLPGGFRSTPAQIAVRS